MSATVAIEEAHAQTLLDALDLDVESAFVLICRKEGDGDKSVLLVRDVHVVDAPHYDLRDADQMVIRSSGWVPALGRAADDGCGIVFAHTHPDGHARLSDRDHLVDEEARPVALERTGAGWYASLVLAGTSSAPAIVGELWAANSDSSVPITRLRVAGPRRMKVVTGESELGQLDLDLFSRNILAFGESGQHLLGLLRVAVVGLGGTGSAVAELLIRLGVRDILLIDPDHLERSNITRVLGSTPAAVGEPKALIAARHARTIAPDVYATPVVGSITEEAIARQLVDRDLIFGCTDDNSGRLLLCRYPSHLLVPVIDCGVLLEGDSGTLDSIDMRVSRMGVGSACLQCRGRIDLKLAAAEELDPEERARRAGEGYVPGVGGPAPAVVAYTTMTASMAIHEMFDMLFGIRQTEGNETLVLLGEDLIGTSHRNPLPDHFCQTRAQRAAGGGAPFLGRVWTR